MAEVFKKIPSALKKQILIRLAGSGLGIVMLILILSYRGSWQLIIPGIAIFLAFFTSAALLFIKCAAESYVVIHGECIEIEKTGLRKRIKAVYIQQDCRRVKVMNQVQRLRNLNVGDKLAIYMSESAPVYDHDGCYVVFNVIAVGKEW